MRVAPATGSTAVTCCSGARRIGTMRARIASAISSGVRAPMITAYVGDVPPAISKPLIAQYKKQYSRTYVSYAGGTTDTPAPTCASTAAGLDRVRRAEHRQGLLALPLRLPRQEARLRRRLTRTRA